MTRLTKFSDAFWSTDFVSTVGCDALCKRLKDGKQTCKDLEDFLKQRAKIEEEYSKSLLKLVKSCSPGLEIGSLRTAWETMKSQTEKAAQEHQEACNGFTEQITRINGFVETQKPKRKATEENARKFIKKKTDSYKKTMESKKTYDKLCREADLADEQVKVHKAQGTQLPPKEWEKLYTKQSKSRLEAEKSDQVYKANIENLDQARQQWEREMAAACEVFQQLEEERIAFLRNELWVHANIISQTCIDNDAHSEQVRRTLEKCSVEEDIIHFINEKSTGTEKPAPVKYENYYEAKVPGKKEKERPAALLPLPTTGLPLGTARAVVTDDHIYSSVP